MKRRSLFVALMLALALAVLAPLGAPKAPSEIEAAEADLLALSALVDLSLDGLPPDEPSATPPLDANAAPTGDPAAEDPATDDPAISSEAADLPETASPEPVIDGLSATIGSLVEPVDPEGELGSGNAPRPQHDGGMTTAVLLPEAAPLPACAYKDIKTRFRSLSHWRKTLLDTRLMVGKNYQPKDLVPVSRAKIAGSGKVRALVIDDLRAMAKAARQAGKAIAVRSAYRSFASQRSVFASWVAKMGYQRALQTSARPGHSEHQLGTSLDFRSASSTTAPWDYRDWATTKPGKWMKNNAWKYGFVMSYPKGKTGKSCYKYEPWHYRYVGRELAKAVHDSGLTLRQYLWRNFESAP